MPVRATEVEEAARDPRGRGIAWLLREERKNPLAALMGRWFPALNRPSDRLISLWVSRDDGSEFRRLGLVEAVASSGFTFKNYSLSWRPDSNAVALIYRDAVWEIPVSMAR